MRTKKAYLVIVILLLGSLAGNRVCAQFTPGRCGDLYYPDRSGSEDLRRQK